MKKLTAILLVILMLISIFVSCGGNDETTTTEAPTTEALTTEAPTTEAPPPSSDTNIPIEYEYQVYEMGGFLNFYDKYGLIHGYELDKSIGSTILFTNDSTVPQQMTIMFEGVQYECSYTETISAYGYLYHDAYKCTVSTPNGNIIRRFGLNRDTKEIVYLFDYKDFYYVDPPDEDALSYDEIKILAEEFLKKYVTDPEAYVLTDNGENMSGDQYFTFTRFIGEIETFDEVTVSFDDFGNLRRIEVYNVNKLKGYSFSEIYDEEKLTQAVVSKLDKIYAEAFKKSGATKFEHRFDKTKLVKLANGQYAISYDIKTTFYWSDNSYRSDLCHILAYLP